MATSYKIIKEINLIIMTSSGPANPEEVIDMFTRIKAEPDYSVSYDVLWDASGRTVPFSNEQIMRVVSQVPVYKGNRRPKRAFLFSKDVDFGMGSVYQGYRSIKSNVDIKVFKNREEALKWLGLHDHPLFRTPKK
jgi:hypothetical protein